MKATSAVLGVLLLLAACGGDDSDGGNDGGGNADADPNAPDGGPLSAQIFDHNHINVEDISGSCIDQLTSGDFVFHYGHRSHGSQLIVGANDLEAELPDLTFADAYCSIPNEAGALKMWDGMTEGTGNLVAQEQYWDSEGGLDELRGILTDNPEIKYSMWAWSFEISEQSDESVQKYLDTVDMLEGEFPNVRFILMNGPAVPDPFMAANRRDRNQQIRDYAMSNGKLLYDFEDLDAWSNGESHTESYEGEDVPAEHPDFREDEPGYEFTHTSQDNCLQKARAFWGMMAELECD